MIAFPASCPHCNASLNGPDIYENFLAFFKDEERALVAAQELGWTKENPICFTSVITVCGDDPVYYICPICEKTIEPSGK